MAQPFRDGVNRNTFLNKSAGKGMAKGDELYPRSIREVKKNFHEPREPSLFSPKITVDVLGQDLLDLLGRGNLKVGVDDGVGNLVGKHPIRHSIDSDGNGAAFVRVRGDIAAGIFRLQIDIQMKSFRVNSQDHFHPLEDLVHPVPHKLGVITGSQSLSADPPREIVQLLLLGVVNGAESRLKESLRLSEKV